MSTQNDLIVMPYGTPTFVEQYVAIDSKQTWLVDHVIPTSGLALLYGAPKTGKSMLALQLTHALTNGLPDFFGFKVQQSGRVLYLQLDTPRALWQERINDWDRMGLTFPSGCHAIEDKESVPYPFNVLNPTHAGWLAQAVAVVNPILVVVDVWRECFRGDENDSDLGQRAVSALAKACHPAATLIVAHGKKPPADPRHSYGIMDEIRGSSYLPGAVDSVMRFRSPEGSRTGTLGLMGRSLEYVEIAAQRGDMGLWAPV